MKELQTVLKTILQSNLQTKIYWRLPLLIRVMPMSTAFKNFTQ